MVIENLSFSSFLIAVFVSIVDLRVKGFPLQDGRFTRGGEHPSAPISEVRYFYENTYKSNKLLEKLFS
ncbi:hypothetical protein QO000_003787 [Alkalihalobacillus hemicentroti]|uniref:Uncharacterized protein n=1 Tax=Guptibacillus hwajinpoensis TaxID=208199 RepID=A0ABU0K601_9BACL|nr:hypothetical protein [Alkalihalobacillus hemicentroti]